MVNCIECFHSRGQHLWKFIETKETVCIRKKFNSQRISLGHQHGRRFIVSGHQYGRRDVMWKHSIHFWRPRKKTTPVIVTGNFKFCLRRNLSSNLRWYRVVSCGDGEEMNGGLLNEQSCCFTYWTHVFSFFTVGVGVLACRFILSSLF